MLKILQKYLITETAKSTITVLVILLVILSSNTMMRLIKEASEGNFPTHLLMPSIIIKVVQYSIYLIPISLFFGIILSLGRLYSTNEMTIITSSGNSSIDVAKLLTKFILIVSLTVAFFTLYLTPLTTEYRYKLQHRLDNEERIQELTPGKFQKSRNNSSTFFAHKREDDRLKNIFYSSQTLETETTETANNATYIFENDQKFILMRNGTIYQIFRDFHKDALENNPESVEDNIIRKTIYEEHALQLTQALPEFLNTNLDAKSTIKLFGSTNLEEIAELQFRFLLPFAALLLGFLAIPLSYSEPKKGRYSRIFIAAITYFLYFVAMSITKSLYILKYTPNFFGIWWVHILFLFFIIYFYRNDYHFIKSRN